MSKNQSPPRYRPYHDSEKLTRSLLSDGFTAEPITTDTLRVRIERGGTDLLQHAVESRTGEFVMDATDATVFIQLGEEHKPGLGTPWSIDDYDGKRR